MKSVDSGIKKLWINSILSQEVVPNKNYLWEFFTLFFLKYILLIKTCIYQKNHIFI